MRLYSVDLMKEFYARFSAEFPDLSIEDMTAVCHHPYDYVRDCIQGDDIVRIRLKFLGCFQVYEGRAKYFLYKLKKQLDFGSIDKETYDRVSGMINRYLGNE